MQTEAERIAAGLTPAGADCLLMVEKSGLCHPRSRMHDGLKNSIPRGLARLRRENGLSVWTLTPLGRAVAEAIRAQEGGDA